MKTILNLLALAALTIAAHAQTNRSLVYNISNNTVIGPTNTNASELIFTNSLFLQAGLGLGGALYFDDGAAEAATRENLKLGTNDIVRFGSLWLQNSSFGARSNSITTWIDGLAFLTEGVTYFTTDTAQGGYVEFAKPLGFSGTNTAATTRSNLFGSAGISTNIQFVRVGGTTNTLVFSNGILHSVTTP